MPTTPQTFCEQCLRPTTHGDCERHPYARQLSMSDPEDLEYYRLMKKLRRGRQLPWIGVGLYGLTAVTIGVVTSVMEPNASLFELFLVSNGLMVLAGLLALPLLGALWFFGVLSRDLLIGIRRFIWGIEIEELPEMLTAPIEDPDPMLSAEEARTLRQTHREARARAGNARFLL